MKIHSEHVDKRKRRIVKYGQGEEIGNSFPSYSLGSTSTTTTSPSAFAMFAEKESQSSNDLRRRQGCKNKQGQGQGLYEDINKSSIISRETSTGTTDGSNNRKDQQLIGRPSKKNVTDFRTRNAEKIEASIAQVFFKFVSNLCCEYHLIFYFLDGPTFSSNGKFSERAIQCY